MKTLHLTLKKKWFDMILSGEKKEEYRELTEYWFSRLLYKIPVPHGGYWSAAAYIRRGDYLCMEWQKFTGGAPVFEKFDAVCFTNGYGKHLPSFTIECKQITIGTGKSEWGGGNITFIINLGKIIETKNIKA